MSESTGTPEHVASPQPEKPFNPADMLRTMYTIGADELWFEEHGSEPDRGSEDYQKFVDGKLAPIDFQNRQGWQKNAELEEELGSAAIRRTQRLLGSK